MARKRAIFDAVMEKADQERYGHLITFRYAEGAHGEDGITCLVCDRTSWNRNDVTNRYCGACHFYHASMQAKKMYGVKLELARRRRRRLAGLAAAAVAGILAAMLLSGCATTGKALWWLFYVDGNKYEYNHLEKRFELRNAGQTSK